jgi:hypothetical protein
LKNEKGLSDFSKTKNVLKKSDKPSLSGTAAQSFQMEAPSPRFDEMLFELVRL